MCQAVSANGFSINFLRLGAEKLNELSISATSLALT